MHRLLHGLWVLSGRAGFYILYPLLAFYLAREERTRILLSLKGKILLVHPWLNDGSWDLPGGGLYPGEDPADGGCREVIEELGIKVDRRHLIYLENAVHRSGLIRYKVHYLQAGLVKNPQLRIQKSELTDARWFGLEQISGLKVNQTSAEIINKFFGSLTE